jgi:ABC-type Zn uptake system ZnuABC Zn-binding protein ZnuA
MRLFALAGIVALASVACGDGSDLTATGAASGDEPSQRLQVVTTTTIIAALAKEVGGELIAVQSILQPGVDPHTFEPSPDQATDVAEADLALMNGIELDEYLLDFVESANADAPVIVVTDGIELLGFEEGDGHEEDEHSADEHGEFDPHVWQDPLRVQLMVDNIAAALAEADGANADAYQANAAAYNARLDELDAEIRAMLDPIPAENRKVVTNHEALAYFAERYEIEIVGTVIPGAAADVEPSAQEIAELVEIIEHEQVRAIFAEQLIDPKIAEQIANDTSVEIVYGIYTDSVGEPGSGAETVDGMLLQNATKFRDALSD